MSARVLDLKPDESVYTMELGLGDDLSRYPYWVDGPTIIGTKVEIQTFAETFTAWRYPDGNPGNVMIVHVYGVGMPDMRNRVVEVVHKSRVEAQP